ncbi:MAG0480 family ComEC-like protein [Mycoplasma sp. 744]|uniref:MAG0480 family ComEC-like protein n=1 Tax=Mycoplasma sp. 744 TaxID=3108531 RepID=UPI003A599795
MKWFITNKRFRKENARKNKTEFCHLIDLNILIITLLIDYIFIFSFEIWYIFIIPVFWLNLILYKKSIFLCVISQIFILIVIILFINQNNFLEDGNYNIISTIKINKDKYFLINYNNFNILVFKNEHIQREQLSVFSLIEIKGKIEIFNNSNFFNWTKEQNILYILKNPVLKNVIRSEYNLFDNFINKFNSNLPYFNKYWSYFLYGIKSNNNNLNENITNLGLNHLFVVSGFHLDILFLIVSLFKTKNKIINIIITCVFYFLILNYIILLNNPISALRVFIFKILIDIKNIFFKKYYISKYSILIFSMFIIILINWRWIYNVGFLLSFSNTVFLMFLWDFLKKYKLNKIFTYIIIMFFISVLNYPILIILNKNLPFFSFLWTILLAPIIQLIYICSLLFFWSQYFLNFLFYLLDELLIIANKINIVINIENNIQFYWIYPVYFVILMFLYKLKIKNYL